MTALLTSAVLTSDHLNPGRAFCPLAEACAAASKSELGSFYGIPTSVLGMVAFGGLFLLTLLPVEWALGKRFLAQTYEGPGFNGKMEGRGLLGYDNHKKIYQQTWAMTMGTGIQFSTGSYDAEKKTFTFTSKVLAPDGKTYRNREVVTIKSADEYVSASYASEDKDGAPERKEMEMVVTRAGK